MAETKVYGPTMAYVLRVREALLEAKAEFASKSGEDQLSYVQEVRIEQEGTLVARLVASDVGEDFDIFLPDSAEE